MTLHRRMKLVGQFGTSAWLHALLASCLFPMSSLDRVGTGQSKKKRKPWCCSNNIQQYLEQCYQCHMRGQQLKNYNLLPCLLLLLLLVPHQKRARFYACWFGFFPPFYFPHPFRNWNLGFRNFSQSALISGKSHAHVSACSLPYTELPFYVKIFCTKASKTSMHGSVRPLSDLEARSDGNQPCAGNGFESHWLLIIPCKCAKLHV